MKRLVLSLLLLAADLPVHAEWAVEVRDAWIRHLPGDRPMAGYFVVENKGNRDLRLVGASSVAFGRIRMHESTDENGTTSMRPVESVAVPAGGRVNFQPGGYHLMLMQRRRPLEVGDKVPMTLELHDGGSQSVVFTIKPAWQE